MTYLLVFVITLLLGVIVTMMIGLSVVKYFLAVVAALIALTLLRVLLGFQ